MAHAKTSYVRLPCRASYTQPYDKGRERICPRCAGDLVHVGSSTSGHRSARARTTA
ncbi:hypothetical protein ACWGIU_32920 [Streptomyces sp. NPDC054840]